MRLVAAATLVFAVIFFVGLGVALPKHDPVRTGNESGGAPASVAACQTGRPVEGRFYVKGREVDFRTGPGGEYSSVVNRRATEVLGSTEFRTLWPSMVLKGHCETDEWIEVSIVEADGSPVKWETGWVHKQFVAGQPSDEIRMGLLWDVDDEASFNSEEKEIVKRGALKVLRDEKNCLQIITGYRSGSRKGAYYVTCDAKNGGPPFNVWFTPEAVAAGQQLGVPESYTEAKSRDACEQAIKRKVSHPSTLQIHRVFGYATEVHNNGNRTVVQEFTAKNSFGLELKHQARCLIRPNGSLDISILEVN